MTAVAQAHLLRTQAIETALRDLARTQPEQVRRFVAEHATALSPLTRREVMKHL